MGLVDPREPGAWHPEPFETMVIRRLERVETKVDGLTTWQTEVKVLGRFLQLTFGTSVLAAFIGLLTLAKLLGS